MCEVIDLRQIEVCLLDTGPDSVGRECTRRLFSCEPLFGGGGDRFPVDDQGSGRVEALCDAKGASVEVRKARALESHAVVQSAESNDFHYRGCAMGRGSAIPKTQARLNMSPELFERAHRKGD